MMEGRSRLTCSLAVNEMKPVAVVVVAVVVCPRAAAVIDAAEVAARTWLDKTKFVAKTWPPMFLFLPFLKIVKKKVVYFFFILESLFFSQSSLKSFFES